jgi:hypothetical protein
VGEEVEKFNGQHQPIILMKSARITEFGKTLGTMSGTVMSIQIYRRVISCAVGSIMVKQAILLLRLRQGELKQNLHSACSTGGDGGYTTDWIIMHEAQEANLGNGDKPDYFHCKALPFTRLARSQSATKN